LTTVSLAWTKIAYITHESSCGGGRGRISEVSQLCQCAYWLDCSRFQDCVR